jgi:ribose 5-phosphate isomerase B
MSSKKLIREIDIINFAKSGSKILRVCENTILTPSAIDKVRELKLIVEKSADDKNETVNEDAGTIEQLKRIYIGGDHTGFKVKSMLIKILRDRGHEVIDVGTFNEDSCDYPDFAFEVAKNVANKKLNAGILVDATGIPSAITANKIPGIRATTCYNEFSARSAREHNDSNILVLGAKSLGEETIKSILKVWLETPFLGGRHQKRLDKITSVEQKFVRKF